MMRRLATLLAVLGALLVLPAGPASAHAELASSSPAAGQILDTAPASITVEWDQDVRVLTEATRLTDTSGHEVPTVLDHSGRKLEMTPKSKLTAGGYVIAWAVNSADGHLIRGSIPFAVHDPSDGTASGAAAAGGGEAQLANALAAVESDVPAWVDNAAAGLSRILLILSAAVIVLPGTRLALFGLGAAGLAAFRVGLEVSGPTGTAALSAPSTHAVLVGGVAGVALAAGFRRRAASVLALGLIGSIPFINGHALTMTPSWLWAGLVSVHLVAAVVWVGALVAILADPSKASAANSSRWATRAIVVLLPAALIVGFRLAWGESGFDLSDTWTRFVLAKTGLVGIMLLLGLVHHRAVRAGRSLRRGGVLAEVLLAIVVTALGTTMMTSRPPAETALAAGATSSKGALSSNHVAAAPSALEPKAMEPGVMKPTFMKMVGLSFDDGSRGTLHIHGSLGEPLHLELTVSEVASAPGSVTVEAARAGEAPMTVELSGSTQKAPWTGDLLLSEGVWNINVTARSNDGGFGIESTAQASISLQGEKS